MGQNSKQALYVRKLGRTKNESIETYREFLETRDGIVRANIMICLINQGNYLLDQQIRQLKQDFLKNGGIREKMYQARKNNQKQQLPCL